MTLNETYQEVVAITQKLIELGLSIQQNFPHREGNSISCKAGVDISPVLRNIKYHEKYELLNKEENYNIKLLDGALIQIMYSFNSTGRSLMTHRLAYYPAPHLENYEDNPESYEGEYFGSSEFHDLLENNVIKTPFRFDYNSDATLFKEVDHPYAHFHLGEYEGCRIPVHSPLTPALFINFILRNFYNTALVAYCDNFSFPLTTSFSSTIVGSENSVIHLKF